MPNQRDGSMDDVRSFARAGKLYKSEDEVAKMVEDGGKVIVNESSFSDPGDDYTALYVDDTCVGYWPGY